jgi:[ribosomal protein S18]-alanine N-acetyltransferase
VAAEKKRGLANAGIRAFGEEDAAAAAEILRQSPEAAQWTELGFRELLGWRGVLALVSADGRKVKGFIIGRQVTGEAEILNLAVVPSARRKGEGGALLKVALDEFRARGISRVFLEVRESNESGIAFYERHGFSKSGYRGGYYREPEEAAIAMEKKFTG